MEGKSFDRKENKMTAVVVLSPAELEDIVTRIADRAAKAAVSMVEQTKTEASNKNPELWDAERVGAYLGVSTRHVSERYAFMPGFPRPVQLPTATGTKRARRWESADIIAWAKAQKKVA